MPRLIWTPNALDDVQRLHRWLLSKDAAAAGRAVAAIRVEIGALADAPHIGRPVEEMAAEYREKLIPFGSGGYVALYRLDGNVVTILAVRHQREAGYP